MTKEQINIAIAESQGWKRNMGDWYRPNANCQCITRSKSDGGYTIYPPNYCNDLNAMHEVELNLSTMYRQCYIDNLVILLYGESAQGDGSYEEQWSTLHATALQRAEAYLRTIGKWKDE